MSVLEYLKEIPERNKDRAFLIDSANGDTVTYGQLDKAACSIAAFFISRGIKKGDRIVILLDNSISLAKIYFGCLYAGIVVVPINPVFSEQQIDFIIQNSQAKQVITSPSFRVKLRCDHLEMSGIEVMYLSEEKHNEDETGNNNCCVNFARLETAASDFVRFNGVSKGDDIFIVYTSGTTAEPKGVVHKISSVVENGLLFSDALKLGSNNRFYNILHMAYLGGYYNLLLIPYLCQGSVVLSNAFDAASVLRFWKPAIRYGVNTLWLVPTIISILMELDRGTEGVEYCKSKIDIVISGTAPLPKRLRLDFQKKYQVQILENYGLSETFFVTTQVEEPVPPNTGVGLPLTDVTVRIVNRKDNNVPNGTEGEILVRTPHLMKGYHNQVSDEPDLVFYNGWFRTGDLGLRDDTGNIQITGRKKDLIIRGGINISPAAIEETLYKHPDVLECSIVGIPHRIMGEDIAAVVKLRDGVSFDLVKNELVKLCKEDLAVVQQPAKYFELPEMPHTASGKIQKAKIKAWLSEMLKNYEKTGQTPKKPLISKGLNTARYFQPSKVVTDVAEAKSIMYNNMVYEMKEHGDDPIVLSLGEAFFDLPLFTFEDLPHPQIYHYSHSRGLGELRRNISKYYVDQYDVAFDPDKEIIITAGSKVAIHMAFMSILNQGDEVLIHEPAWVSYPEQVKLCYGVPVQIPYYEEIFDFERYITNRTKAIVINNPNNPRGNVLTLEELSYLYGLAVKYNLFLLADEAYSDFLLEEDQFISVGNLDDEKRHLILCNSLSKNYGLSGWRLGYVVSNVDLIRQILKVNQHLITCPATILEYYMAKHFFELVEITKPQIAQVVKKRRIVTEYLDKVGISYLPGTATFYIFASIEGSSLSSEDFCMRLLKQHAISIVPGIGYGKSCDKFVRLSIGTESLDRIFSALDTIKSFINET